MSDLAALITAIVGILATVGAAGRFVWNKIEARFDAVDAELAKCEARERENQERRAVQLTVIELLWLEVKRLAPDAGVLTRAEKLLGTLRKGEMK